MCGICWLLLLRPQVGSLQLVVSWGTACRCCVQCRAVARSVCVQSVAAKLCLLQQCSSASGVVPQSAERCWPVTCNPAAAAAVCAVCSVSSIVEESWAGLCRHCPLFLDMSVTASPGFL